MKRKLRCSNEDCESHKNEQYMFNVTAVVDEDRQFAENLDKVEASYFECVFCSSEATEVKVNDA